MPHYRDAVTVLTAPLVVQAETGDEVRDWGSATSVVLAASVQRPVTVESTDRRQVSTQTWRVHAELGTVRVTSRVLWRGGTYEVASETGPDDLLGGVAPGSPHDHLEFDIRRVT